MSYRSTSRASHRQWYTDLEGERNTRLVIEGPRRPSFETREQRLRREYEMETRSIRSMGSIRSTKSARSAKSGLSAEGSAWPVGIIKTVSVEIVEEENPDPGRGDMASRLSNRSDEDWEYVLRGGPSGP